MKLVIQIPCLNEAQTLPETIAGIPRTVEGFDLVEILIVDDGSTDDTVAVARAEGVHHVIRLKENMGLAQAFKVGVDAALRAGADVIVNMDGDNQYPGRFIPDLVAPILRGEADIVVGDRQTQNIDSFSWTKKRLQKLGSFVVQNLSGTRIPDAVSGFRAFSREAALRLNIVSSFSYTIETLIQAGNRNMVVRSVPIGTNPTTRPSRLFKSIPRFLERSLKTMLRIYTMYRALKVFLLIGAVITLIGLIPIVSFLIYYLGGNGEGHIQSLVLGGTLVTVGFFTFLIGMIADLISFNRQLIEMTLERVRKIELRLEERTEDTMSPRTAATVKKDQPSPTSAVASIRLG